MRRWFLLIVIVLLSSILLYVDGSKIGKNNKQPIVFIPKTLDKSMEFWQVVQQGLYAAANEYGADVKVLGTEKETDIEGQIQIVREAIAMKPKAILLAATDYEQMGPVAKEIVQAGILLITVDSGLRGGISSSFIATDNYEAGKKAGAALAEALPNKGKVAILNFIKGSSTSIERESGFRDSIKNDSEFQIMDTFYSEGSSEKAYEITKRILTDHPDLQGIVGFNEPTTVGSARAVRDLKKDGQVKLIGFDSSMDEIGFLEDEVIQAIVVQKPFNMGYMAVRTVIQKSNGEKVNERIDTGSEVIWKKTMYTKKNQKLLFPILDKHQ